MKKEGEKRPELTLCTLTKKTKIALTTVSLATIMLVNLKEGPDQAKLCLAPALIYWLAVWTTPTAK